MLLPRPGPSLLKPGKETLIQSRVGGKGVEAPPPPKAMIGGDGRAPEVLLESHDWLRKKLRPTAALIRCWGRRRVRLVGGSPSSLDQVLTNLDVPLGSSVPSIDLDLAGLGQHVNDVGFEVGVVHACLPKLARIPVVLPVVVPIASAVSPEPIHVHLWGG